MKNDLQNNYQNIKQTVTDNLKTIRGLIEQAKGLSRIAEGISNQSDPNKQALEDIIAKIENNISELIDQNEKLFKLYNDFINRVF